MILVTQQKHLGDERRRRREALVKKRRDAKVEEKRKRTSEDLDDIGLAKKYDTLVGLEDFNKSLSIDKKYADARLNRAEMYLLARNQKVCTI